LVVGPQLDPQKRNFSNHISRKATCSRGVIDPWPIYAAIYPDQPLMLLVLNSKVFLVFKLMGLADEVTSRPVSMMISNRVGVIGP
jgi:hypothetical protein